MAQVIGAHIHFETIFGQFMASVGHKDTSIANQTVYTLVRGLEIAGALNYGFQI